MFINAVEIRTNPAGMVLFMSDWLQCDEFAAQGYFRAVNGGPATYGDTFFYLTPAGRQLADAQSREPFVPLGAN